LLDFIYQNMFLKQINIWKLRGKINKLKIYILLLMKNTHVIIFYMVLIIISVDTLKFNGIFFIGKSLYIKSLGIKSLYLYNKLKSY
jgi:hypothetical protein